MKKIYIIIITFLILLTGCTKFLILEPEDELIREEYWKTSSDVVAVLGTSYANLSKILDDVYYWSELRGGLISPGEKVKPETLEFYNFNLNAFNEKTKWNDFYFVINLTNTIIEYAQLAKENDDTYTDKDYNGNIAEAYFLRSMCYFYLVKAFKEVPFITQSYSKDDQDFSYPKSSEQEIITSLISDLNMIVDNAFDVDYFDLLPEKKGRVTKNAVYALLAELYLWNNDYEKCIEQCNKIKGVFLLEGEDYFSLYAENGNTIESIFELQFNRLMYQTNNTVAKDQNLYSITSNNSQGDKQSVVSEYLVGLYSLQDQRQYLGNSSVTYNPNSLSIWKYEGQAPFDENDKFTFNRSYSRSDANWIFYRYSDIILMKAEAYAELGDFQSASLEINTIQERAGMTLFNDNTSQILLLNVILNEKAKEFFGEEKR